jgi:hypothetical protein
MHICAYGVISDPITSKLPVFEVIEALYEHVQEFVIIDSSIYDKVDLTKYGKVRKHVKTILNPFDNPLGGLFTAALRLVDSDTCFFLDFDEIFEFKGENLKDIVARYPIDTGAGIAFSLRNYFCSRNFLTDGCSSKGAHVFRNSSLLFHDLIGHYVVNHSHVRRTSSGPDLNDGVRLVDEQGRPIGHYPPIPLEEVVIHHTSHLDIASKMVRSVLQWNHTSTLDLPEFYPYDMRFKKSTVDKIYELVENDIDNGNILLYSDPIPFNYEPNKYLDAFVKRAGIYEFNPGAYTVIAK